MYEGPSTMENLETVPLTFIFIKIRNVFKFIDVFPKFDKFNQFLVNKTTQIND